MTSPPVWLTILTQLVQNCTKIGWRTKINLKEFHIFHQLIIVIWISLISWNCSFVLTSGSFIFVHQWKSFSGKIKPIWSSSCNIFSCFWECHRSTRFEKLHSETMKPRKQKKFNFHHLSAIDLHWLFKILNN